MAVIDSAKQLVTNLKQDDASLDKLHIDAMAILRKLEAMKEYSDEVSHIESVVKPTNSRGALIAAIQQENRQIKDLKRENIALLGALEEHQNTLQMVMTKYRQHVLALTKNREVEQACAQQLSSSQAVHRLADKISEMAGIMRLAADIDENNSNCTEEQLARLRTENGVLREILQIASSCGSVKNESLQNGFTTIRKNDGCAKTASSEPSAISETPITSSTPTSATTNSAPIENKNATSSRCPSKRIATENK